MSGWLQVVLSIGLCMAVVGIWVAAEKFIDYLRYKKRKEKPEMTEPEPEKQ